jgi:hypothetical protein
VAAALACISPHYALHHRQQRQAATMSYVHCAFITLIHTLRTAASRALDAQTEAIYARALRLSGVGTFFGLIGALRAHGDKRAGEI